MLFLGKVQNSGNMTSMCLSQSHIGAGELLNLNSKNLILKVHIFCGLLRIYELYDFTISQIQPSTIEGIEDISLKMMARYQDVT